RWKAANASTAAERCHQVLSETAGEVTGRVMAARTLRRQPRCHGPKPLDRRLCVPAFRRVCSTDRTLEQSSRFGTMSAVTDVWTQRRSRLRHKVIGPPETPL